MNYLARLRVLKAEKPYGEELTKPTKPGSGSFVSYPDKRTSENSSADPASWQTALAELDACQPPEGFTVARWRELVADARWLADRHGPSAAALGWTAGDLFGLDATLDGWGGVADRLRGARRVAFTDRLAHWRGDDLEGLLWRRTLRPMAPIWAGRGRVP